MYKTAYCMRSVVTDGFQRVRLHLHDSAWERALQSRFALVGEYHESQNARHTVQYFLLTSVCESSAKLYLRLESQGSLVVYSTLQCERVHYCPTLCD